MSDAPDDSTAKPPTEKKLVVHGNGFSADSIAECFAGHIAASKRVPDYEPWTIVMTWGDDRPKVEYEQ